MIIKEFCGKIEKYYFVFCLKTFEYSWEEIKLDINKEKLIKNLTDNLVMLRTGLGFTQEELADKIGLSRSTIFAIENKRSNMTWTVFLALVLVFSKHEETNKLLNVLEIYTDDFNSFIKDK